MALSTSVENLAKLNPEKSGANSLSGSLNNLSASGQDGLEAECAAYSEHINMLLCGGSKTPADKRLAPYLPLPTEPSQAFNELFNRLRDGILLSFFIDGVRKGAVDMGKLRFDIDLAKLKQENSRALFDVNTNLDMAIAGAKAVGCVVVNIGAQDILEMHKDLALGLVWQLVRAHLCERVNILTHPELIRLLEKGETLSTLLSLPADQILLRWFNYHLRRSGSDRVVKNFTKDVCDSEAYAILMSMVAPKIVTAELANNVLNIPAEDFAGRENRARAMLELAEKLGCRKYVTPKDVANGHARLNFAFTATLFNAHIGIRLPSEEELAKIYDELEYLREQVPMLKLRIAELELQKQQAADRADRLEAGLKEEREARQADLRALRDEMERKRLEAEAHLAEERALLKKQEAEAKNKEESLSAEIQEERRRRLSESEAAMKRLAELEKAHEMSGSELEQSYIKRIEGLRAEFETAKQNFLDDTERARARAAEELRKAEERLNDSNSRHEAAKAKLEKEIAALRDQLISYMTLNAKSPVHDLIPPHGSKESAVEAANRESNLTSQLRVLIERLIDENQRQAKALLELQGRVDRNEKFMKLMDTKIAEIAEETTEWKKKTAEPTGKKKKFLL